MKITTLLLFMFIFCLHAENSNSQNVSVTIQKNDVSLENVLNEIEKQTDYLFIYNKHVNVNSKVTVNVKEASLEETLKNILKGTGVKFEIDGSYVLLSPEDGMSNLKTQVFSQSLKEIKGIVKDQNGDPIIGANVMEKGTAHGVITDLAGRFTLQVTTGSILQISYIGYKSVEIPVKNQTLLSIQLEEDMELLEEVVVVGYAVQKKENLSGSVATVDTKKLEDRPIASIGQALQGAVASLNIDPTSGDPNDLPSFNIRGFTSINGGSPLVVIDGVISDAIQLNRLNPADVANISVLKDAASSAIYGSRAAYGVILVTTKTGQSEHVSVNYNNNFSFRSMTNKPQYLLDSYIHYNDWNIANGSPQFPQELLDVAKAYMADHSNPDGLYVPSLGEYFYVRTDDIYDEFYKKNAFSTNHTIDISGKTDKLNYYVSGGYSYQDGLIRYGVFNFSQYNVRSKLDIQLTPWWKMGSNTSFVSSYNRSSSTYVTSYSEALDQVTGNFVAPVKTSDGHWYDFTWQFGDFEEGGRAKKYDDTFSQLFTTKIELIKDVLSLNGQFNYSLQKVKMDYNRLSWDLYVGPGMYDSAFNSPNSVSNENETVKHITLDGYATFNKTFAEKHHLNAILGFNQEEYRFNQQNMSKTQLISQSLPTVQLAYGTPTVGEKTETWALRGLYGRLNYIYDRKYIVEFNFRQDGTSRFPKKDRFVFNPSASVGWIVSEENFFAPLRKAIDMFKIRASLGRLGNQDVGAYAYVSAMNSYKNSFILGGNQPIVVGAPGLIAGNLTWEKVTTADLGIDLTLLGNRLVFTGDLYRRDTKDMLTTGEVLPAVLGTSVPQENAADLKTTGFDLTIGWRDKIQVAGKPLQYSIDFNLSDSQSEITKFSNPTGTLTSYYEGMEIGEIWGLKTLGLYQTDDEAKRGPDQTEILISPAQYPATAGCINFEDRDRDGKISRGKYTLDDHGDYYKIGNSAIRYRFGTTLTASWNGIDFSLFFQGVMKHQYYPGTTDQLFWGKYAAAWYSEMEGHYYDRWRNDNQNPKAYWPVLSHSNASQWSPNRELAIPQTRYLQNAAYIRLKNLTVGYTIPLEWLSKYGIQRLRIFYSGDNLFCASGLYEYYNVDPENLGGHKYPFQKYNSFGINVTF